MAKSRKKIRAEQQIKDAKKTPGPTAVQKGSKWQEFLNRHNVVKPKNQEE